MRDAHFAGVVFARQSVVSIGTCVEHLELIAKVYDTIDVQNRVIYLPL